MDLKLPHKLSDLLKKKGKLTLLLSATVHDPARNTRTVTRLVAVKLKKKHNHHG